MKKMQKIGKTIGLFCLIGAIIDIGIGMHVTDVKRAEYFNHKTDDLAALYDGPWMPIEFILLLVGVGLFKCGDPESSK